MIKQIGALMFAITLTNIALAQTARQPQFENDTVKVWKSTILPNSPLPLHRHDHPRVLIAITGGKIKIAEENGNNETHLWEAGKAYWLPANKPGTLHTDENMGNKPIEVMVVELLKESAE